MSNPDSRPLIGDRFVPGFADRANAAKAGAKFFATTSGRKGVEGRDFHLVQNTLGRWHFEEGRAVTDALADPAPAEEMKP